ncbi:hypothetical protein EDD11_003658 [Mortierella claussenii]|nr:hypothetical protein EDD11_003658 [Mortierella claussenii]
MAPRTRKTTTSTKKSRQGQGDHVYDDGAGAGPSKSVSRKGKSAAVASIRSARRSTQNATNLKNETDEETEQAQDKVDEKNGMDVSDEDEDFQDAPSTYSSANQRSRAPVSAASSSSSSTVTTGIANGQKKKTSKSNSGSLIASSRSSANDKKRAAEEEAFPSPSLKQKYGKTIKNEDLGSFDDEDSDKDILLKHGKRKLKEDDDTEPSIPGSVSDDGSEFFMDEDDDEEEEEWEEVSISAMTREMEDDDDLVEESEELSGPWQYNAVEIVFDKPLDEIKKRATNKGITKEERMIRVLIHQTHLLCLLANGLRRNRWISHPKLSAVALSLVPDHIARTVRIVHENNPTREVNALQVLALWWRDSFVVTGPGLQSREYMDLDVVGVEAAMVVSNEECLKQRKNLQRRLLNRSGSSDVSSQLFTGICRALGLRARLVESLQACTFKVSFSKEDPALSTKSDPGSSSRWTESKKNSSKSKRKKKEEILDESDTTRGSRVVLQTPHRLPKKPTKLPSSHKSANPPVFWTEVYSATSQKWITIDPIRGIVNSPLKMHPPSSCSNNVLAYVVAYDEDNYVTDVTRRYTSMWGTTTKKLRVQPSANGFDWWKRTLSGLMNPHRTMEEDLEEEELLLAEVSERMPTKLGDFNNHPLYALERHIKKYEVLHPRIPVLGHIRGEAIYPRSCVKQVKSKENWLRRGRVIKAEETKPVKWVKSYASTVFQMRLRQQMAISGTSSSKHGLRKRQTTEDDDEENDGEVMSQAEGVSPAGGSMEDGADQIPLWGEWQTEAYQPPWVVDGKVPRNQFGRQDVFTPDMVPLGGTHLKGRNLGQVARLLGVDYVEAVTGFEFQSRRSIPVIQGIIVPTEQAELVMDAYYEIAHQRDQEAHKRKRAESLKRWRKLIKGLMTRSRLMEEYGEDGMGEDKDMWVPEDEDEDDENKRDRQSDNGTTGSVFQPPSQPGSHHPQQPEQEQRQKQPQNDADLEDSGAGFMVN